MARRLVILRREGALPGSSDWTHQYADAGNSVVSKDSLVKAPLGLLWFGGPSNDKVLPRHGHGPSPQVAGGRLVIEGADMLRCVDVYTGRVLWERDLPGLGTYYDTTSHFAGAGEIGSNYVTMQDAVYVVYGDSILELSVKTGETRRQFQLKPDEATKNPTWGYIAVEGNLLVATSSPVAVTDGDAKVVAKVATIPSDMRPLIAGGEKWEYLVGSDPVEEWHSLDFKPGQLWKSDVAGFGYGDNDDRTLLNGMRGKHGRVYLRKTFDGKEALKSGKLVLSVNYDDAFIAYLNGKEIVRAGVSKGNGAKAERISGHEATGHELFEIKDFQKLLKPGKNVIALEGHNSSLDSSDFSLDPLLLISSTTSRETVKKESPKKPEQKVASIEDAFSKPRYSSASRQLVVFDRMTGKQLWSRNAEFNFRHNAIAVAGGTVFCIDRLSDSKLDQLKRRGVDASGQPKLMALDGRTGEVNWATDENVFGTFLNYSTENDVLLQAGSKYRDRAKDEVGQGMVAYRGTTGEVIWENLDQSYGGPCLLWKDKIITNGGGGFRLDLLTGKNADWSYTRMYGCNTAVGSQNLLTFRSGAAGFCDLAADSGTGNIGGFRSSCTANLIVADGVLNAPDYTRTCSCAYQNQSSLALIHMPEAESWTFSSLGTPPEEFGMNLGAAGDRRDDSGTIWYDVPSVGGNSPRLPVTLNGEAVRTVRHHSSVVEAASEKDAAWIASSCVTGLESIEWTLSEKPRPYIVRLHFAELENVPPGERLFDVIINGETRLMNFDIAKEAGGTRQSIVKEFGGVEAAKTLRVEFKSNRGMACLSGIEVVAE